MQVKIELLQGGKLLRRMTDGAIGYDIYCPKDTRIFKGRNIVPLGFKMAMPADVAGIMKGRSGFEAKGFEGYPMAWDGKAYGDAQRFDADVLDGTIDPDYRGEVGCIIKSNELAPFIVKAGTRIAQMVFVRVALPDIVEVKDVGAGGHGGFGSTGTNNDAL